MTKRSALPLAAYYVTLATLVIGAFFPEQRIWGVNWWGYYPLWVVLVLAALGAVAPLILRFFERRWDSPPENAELSDRGLRYWLPAAGLIALFSLLFYLLRAETHFLGDGYALLSVLGEKSPLALKVREVGESLVHIWSRLALGGVGQAALIGSQIISIASGVAFLTAIGFFAGRLFERTSDRLLFLMGLASGGYMLLFFGYVEYYSLFVLSVLVFTLTGLLVSRGEANRWLMLPLLALAVFFHILGVTLIPAAVYLLVIRTRAGHAIARMKLTSRAAIALITVCLLYTSPSPRDQRGSRMPSSA